MAGWLQNHLESFVQPVLGFIPTLEKGDPRFFTAEEMAILKAMWKGVKRESVRLGKPILLAGRDVFVFEILARRENFPTVFRPDISRLTVAHVTEDYSQHLLFDTGFAGSIPKALKSQSYVMGSVSGIEAKTTSYPDPYAALYRPTRRLRSAIKHVPIKQETHQVFPRLKGARSLILNIERTPKYWKRGYWRQACKCAEPMHNPLNLPNMDKECWTCLGKVNYTGPVGIMQDQSDLLEFLKAAKLTIEIYKDSSPAFVDKPVTVTSHSVNYHYGSD